MRNGRTRKIHEIPEPDLRRFAPREAGQGTTPLAPALDEVREISAAAGFPSRDALARSLQAPPLVERHYYRTGRDTQFNTKVRPDIKAGYVAIASADGVPMGKVLEDALAALLRERKGRS